MKGLMKMKWFALAAALAFSACDDDEVTNPPSDAGDLGNELEVRVSALEEAKASLEQMAAGLQTEQKNLEDSLKAMQSRLDAMQSQTGNLQSQTGNLQSQIESAMERIAAAETQIDGLKTLRDEVNSKIDGLDTAIDEIRSLAEQNQSDVSALKEQVKKANEQIGEVLPLVAKVEALQDMLSGFDEGTNIRQYIDKAVESVNSALGNYVLKEEYDKFYESYQTFMADYNTSMNGILDSLNLLKQQIADGLGSTDSYDDSKLSARIDTLENKLEELEEEVKAPFDYTTEEFLAGVTGVIEKALEKDGLISTALTAELEKLRATYDEKISALEARVGSLEVRVEKLEEAKTALEDLVKGLQEQIQQLQQSPGGSTPGQETNVQWRIDSLAAVTEDVKKQIGELNAAIGEIRSLAEQNQNDVSALKKQMEAATGQIDEVLKLAARVEALEKMLSGFDTGTDIKQYIDDAVNGAVESVNSSLGKYVLRDEYDNFYKEYKDFIAGYTGSMRDILDSIANLREQIATNGNSSAEEVKGLTERVEKLESDLQTLQEEVKKPFDYASEEFLKGVKDVIEKALEKDGLISTALTAELDKLRATYDEKISALEEQVGELDGKITALLNRIQSLVYVPETNDGKIHIGASYIKGTSGDSIGVTETKKLRYRVSPASLRDSLVEFLLPAEYTFWQDHVTRIEEANKKVGLRKVMAAKRAEHDGLNEFNIVKVEAGTREGELLITVDNEHDFTHEDLAVALCIKHEDTESGVLTEFVSPYTVVVGKGENIASHFYAAKKEADGSYSSVSRNNVVEYTRRYNDPTPVRIMEGYELVYDDGEEVMSLEDAKAKYEWDGDLQGEFKYKNTGSAGGTLTSSDFDLNKNDSTFTLKSPGKLENVGKSWYIYIDPTITKESKTAVVGPQIKVEVLILPESYEVKAEVVWNSDKWRSGVQTGLGWTSDAAAYTTAAATLTGTGSGNLQGDDIRQIFEDGKKWEIEGDDSGILKDEGGLDITATTVSGHLAFIVKGFKYCNGEHELKFKESEHNGVKVTGTIKFVGPDDSNRKVTLNDVEMKTDPQDASYSKFHSISAGYPLIFMSAAADYPDGQKLPYGDEEITKFFSGDRGKVMDWMTWAVTHKKFTLEGQETPCQKTNEDGDGPASVKLGLSERGGRPYVMMATIYVENNDSIKNLKTASTYQIPDGMKIKIEDGPEIPVSGTFKFEP